jgi:hypothetical protein
MNCVTVRNALAFEDATLAIDPDALREHLRGCASCRAEHFDVVALFCLRAASRPSSRWSGRLAAAAIAILGVGFALSRVEPTPRANTVATARVTRANTPPRVVPPSPRAVSRIDGVTHELVAYAHGRERAVDRVTRRVERAPGVQR